MISKNIAFKLQTVQFSVLFVSSPVLYLHDSYGESVAVALESIDDVVSNDSLLPCKDSLSSCNDDGSRLKPDSWWVWGTMIALQSLADTPSFTLRKCEVLLPHSSWSQILWYLLFQRSNSISFFQSQLSSSLCLSILVGIVYRVHHWAA